MGYDRVLVTLDGSKFAEIALEHAIKIASPGANIHVLSVMAQDAISEMASLVSAVAQPPATEDQTWPPIQKPDDPRAAHAREGYLRQVSDWLAQAGYDVTVEVRPGSVIETIVSVAQDGFQIIVMATHGRSGIARVALGSVAEGVLHRSPCPVLIIPARAVPPQA
ncbi:MAG: universal stress protein [Chloroflexi bacterium CFX4]|nr:universal stress protein [Chloroflexi bacterium CFX4]MDL1922912.1 universal stress protein [Chloroflexi bacterium CFX3]